MRKKIAIFAAAFLIGMIGVNETSLNVSAQEAEIEVDASYLLTEDAIIGYMETQPKGSYLMNGYSAIKDGGAGKIIAGGGTNASTPCKVTLNVIVERLSGGNWVRVTSWTVTNENAFSALSSKIISVGSGYYYRVRCVHFAASDTSSSMTSSLWM